MSGSQGESHDIKKSKTSRKGTGKAGGAKDGSGGGGGGSRKHRSADLGRALRSVYDDTLRETVPSDFLDLLGKLS